MPWPVLHDLWTNGSPRVPLPSDKVSDLQGNEKERESFVLYKINTNSLRFSSEGLYGQIPKPPPVPGPSQISVFIDF